MGAASASSRGSHEAEPTSSLPGFRGPRGGLGWSRDRLRVLAVESVTPAPLTHGRGAPGAPLVRALAEGSVQGPGSHFVDGSVLREDGERCRAVVVLAGGGGAPRPLWPLGSGPPTLLPSPAACVSGAGCACESLPARGTFPFVRPDLYLLYLVLTPLGCGAPCGGGRAQVRTHGSPAPTPAFAIGSRRRWLVRPLLQHFLGSRDPAPATATAVTSPAPGVPQAPRDSPRPLRHVTNGGQDSQSERSLDWAGGLNTGHPPPWDLSAGSGTQQVDKDTVAPPSKEGVAGDAGSLALPSRAGNNILPKPLRRAQGLVRAFVHLCETVALT
uniref:uncharacterized protein LOC103792988 n=1 Tax=Callithrix jacchus TaxID=9483 RepID=UPI0023DD3C37|nr:uncharacterized protein LOC103792988 [Callithrix jacchus]